MLDRSEITPYFPPRQQLFYPKGKEMEPERLEAARKGETFYEGKECIRGHGTTRYVMSGTCRECQREKSLKRYQRVKEQLQAARGEG